MKLKKPSPSAAHRQLVDSLMDGYVTWREECAAVAASYQNWVRSDRQMRELAYDAYLAALDREEDAASAYQRLIERVAATHRFKTQAAAV